MPILPTPILAVSLILATILCSGCGSDAFRRYDAAVLAIEDGRNQAAFYDARQAARGLRGADRLRAEYVAGIAATRLGKTTEARQHLQNASRAVDPDVAGRARLQLGSIEMSEGLFRQAAANFESAARIIGEPLRSRGWLLAAEAFESADLTSDARRCLARASRGADDSSAVIAANRLEETGYTIQFGSFSSQTNALKRAKEVESDVRKNGLGAVRVRSLNGAWKVQAGVFSDRRRAGYALQSLKRTDAVVIQLGR